ncbi:MAG: MvaI/BcnI family restriction endonuclease [Acidobacteria bacterium]|nr:MvaI/BcnI family restriction endonuclease [Acidobacteriota bacterium]
MSREAMTLDEFRAAFARIKRLGHVRSTRSGPTGVGHTFESVLGLKEDNVALPDLGEVEVKARRVDSGSMVTLFTFNRKAWRMKPLEAVRKYGTLDKNGRQGLYFTMTRTPNSMGLLLHLEEEIISIRHVSGEVVAVWNLGELAQQFMRKMPALIIVSALSELRDGVEWFNFTRAQLLSGTSPDILREQILAGNILVDLRLHDQSTRARNHGTAFRAREGKLVSLFREVTEL